MSSVMTYNSLVADILAYQERADTQLMNQIPRCIMLAENQVATELKLLGFQTVVTGNMQANLNTLPKPSYWKDTISFNLTVAGKRVQLLPRTLEYARNYWPDPTKSDAPRFYADYDFYNFFLAATPDQAYPFELVYSARLVPLDPSTQTNWLTINAPALMFYASMIEVQTFLKNQNGIAMWQGKYDRSMAAYNSEDTNRASDRTTKNG